MAGLPGFQQAELQLNPTPYTFDAANGLKIRARRCAESGVWSCRNVLPKARCPGDRRRALGVQDAGAGVHTRGCRVAVHDATTGLPGWRWKRV